MDSNLAAVQDEASLSREQQGTRKENIPQKEPPHLVKIRHAENTDTLALLNRRDEFPQSKHRMVNVCPNLLFLYCSLSLREITRAGSQCEHANKLKIGPNEPGIEPQILPAAVQ
jgi:hypothetical protein